MIERSQVYINELDLVRKDKSFKATLCCCYFSCKRDYDEVVSHLHSQERNYYNSLKFEKRIRSFLMGRFVAKKAVALLSGEKELANVLIQSGVFNQPIVASNGQNIQVSVTHSEDFGAALAFPEAHPMGIDLEKINTQKREALEGQATEWEKDKIAALPILYDVGLTLLWTTKEALSKVLKTGLMTPFDVLEICQIELYDNNIMCYFKNFPQYKASSFTINNYMCSIVYPLKTEVCLNPNSLKLNFSFADTVDNLKVPIF